MSLQWFDYWLKGNDLPIVEESPAKIFIMGKNEWHQASCFPFPSTYHQYWYLSSKKGARSINGVQGQAYILGSYMFSVIDKYLGVEQAKKLVYNPLNFMAIYNKAAKLSNEQKGGCFVFSQKLVEKLSAYYTSLSN